MLKRCSGGLGNDLGRLVVDSLSAQEPLDGEALLAQAAALLSLSCLQGFSRQSLDRAQGLLSRHLPVAEPFGDGLGTLADRDQGRTKDVILLHRVVQALEQVDALDGVGSLPAHYFIDGLVRK